MRLPVARLGNARGATIIFIAVGLVMIIGFIVLSMDLGTLLLTRSQLQNAADAGALLSGGDQTEATALAIELVGDNKAFIQETGQPWNVMSSVVITSDDVTFPQSNWVRVTTHRTTATGDPIRTPFLNVIKPASGGLSSVTARATASYEWQCGAKCVKPWAPPDKWDDNDSSGTWTTGDFYDPILTGYVAPRDLGMEVVVKVGNGSDPEFGPFWYYAVDFPPLNKGTPITGADQYRSWIEDDCLDPTFVVEPGDTLQLEPGSMTGPTAQGLNYLIALDPSAEWDAGSGTVINSAFPSSPRIIKACLFDPSVGVLNVGGGRKDLVVVKIIAMFLAENQGGGEVRAYFMRDAAPDGEDCEPGGESFLYTVQLVE
jgi:Flp pilus assembly protein TadG